jgi:CHAD domain-containing protein
VAKASRYEQFSPDAPVAAAGRSILRTLLAAVADEATAVCGGDDVKATHDMRVAIRRLRSAIDTFGDQFRSRRFRRFAKATRRLGRRLGAVRDADVHLAVLRSSLSEAAREQLDGIAFAIETISAQREHDLERFKDAFSSYDFRECERAIDDG